jgi:hypothetical protein
LGTFTTVLTKAGYGGGAVTLPSDLIIIPESWSASDRGGMQAATLNASGSAESLASLSGWLGDRLEIFNEQGDAVFWGRLWDVEINLGNVLLTSTMDNVYNRVKVIYAYTLPDGSVESRTTDWVEDATSLARYGARELLYGLPDTFMVSADVVRDNLLAYYKDAAPVTTTQAQVQWGARLFARGLWEAAASVYFTNPDGLVEHDGESSTLSIGRYLESDEISFGTLTPGGDADEIHIATGDFDPLTTGDSFTISGASVGANNDTYTVAGQDASNQITISGTFADEAAGATVRVSPGESMAHDNVAISFVPATSWDCTHVAVKVRQVGSPSDSFRIGIYPDSSGAPGTVIQAKETLGSLLFTDLTWTEFELPAPVALVGGTTYWLAMRRTGTANPDDGYEIAVDEDLGYTGGVLKVYNGVSWVARDPDSDMPFRIIGEIDSTAQIAKALAAVSAFDQSLIQVTSGIPVRQFVEDERTVMEEIMDMLDAGTASGLRLVAWVDRDDSVIIGTENSAGYGDSYAVLDSDGRLHHSAGGFFAPGLLVYGRHIELAALHLLSGMDVQANRASTLYVQSSEYQASTDIVTISSLGALDPYQMLTTRRG